MSAQKRNIGTDVLNKLSKSCESETANCKNFISFAFLQDMLKCSVCLGQFRTGHIFSCPNMHSFCDECKTRLTACAVCSSRPVSIRNFNLEQLRDERKSHGYIYNCSGEPFGCDYKDVFDAVYAHEESCEMVPIRCFLGTYSRTCNFSSPKVALLAHMQKSCSSYKDSLQEKANKWEFPVTFSGANDPNEVFHSCHASEVLWLPILLKGNSELVRKVMPHLLVTRSSQGLWHVLVSGLGQEEQLSRYCYSIKLRSERENLSNFTFEFGNVLTPTQFFKNSINQGICLQLSDAQLKRLKTGQNLFMIAIEIYQKCSSNPVSST
jgi:hypothetical protein